MLAEPVFSTTFEDEWSRFAAGSPLGIFATPEWHRAVEAGFGDVGRTETVDLWEDGCLVGVAPLRFHRRGALRVVTFAGMAAWGGYGIADYGGLVAPPGREREAARAAVRWLADRGGWDVLDLQQLPQGASVEGLAEAVERAGFRSLTRLHNVCHRIELPAGWDAYRASLSANAREWLERKPRKLERELGARSELVPGAEALAEYQNLRRLVSLRFGVGYGPRQGARLQAAMNAWLPLAAARGYLRMFRLRTGGETIGVLLGYELGGTYYFHICGYDQGDRFKSYSLGACLLAGAIRWSLESGLEGFDLMRGDYPYKARLGTSPRSNYRLMAFRSPLLARAVQGGLRARAGLSRTAGRLRGREGG